MFNGLGLKNILPSFWNRGTVGPEYQVTPDEIDAYQWYYIINPDNTYNSLATAAGGTAAQTKAFTLKQKRLDYPRNLNVSVTGTADIGGTATVNGYDQFGNPITESIGFGTATAGTPGGYNEGTKIFSQVTSGTFTVAGVGSGSASIGPGTTEGSVKFGLPCKIASIYDVKNIVWTDENAWTTFAGGTYSTSHIDTTNHAIIATAALAGTQTFAIQIKSTYDGSGDSRRQSGL